MIGYVEELFATVLSGIVGGFYWLVRTVLTNNKQIALLQADISAREDRRKEDRAILQQLREELKSEMRETREDIEDIRSELLDVWKTK